MGDRAGFYAGVAGAESTGAGECALVQQITRIHQAAAVSTAARAYIMRCRQAVYA